MNTLLVQRYSLFLGLGWYWNVCNVSLVVQGYRGILWAARGPPRRSLSQLHSTTEEQSPSVPDFHVKAFTTECDNVNRPPSLNIFIRSLQQLTSSGTDIRGTFVDHKRLGNIAMVAHKIGKEAMGGIPPLTPLAAHCFGHALASMLLDQQAQLGKLDGSSIITIAIGTDPRKHGMRITDAFARGAESRDPRIKVVYAGLASTPACAFFTRQFPVQAGVVVTASHLPKDRNGLKFFMNTEDCLFTREMVQELGWRAQECATDLFQNSYTLPPTSGDQAVMCSQWVSWMPEYSAFLKNAIQNEVSVSDDTDCEQPLKGLKIVLNAGNGAGGFFNSVLEDLGADVSSSIHLEPDGEFPNGIPNPEDPGFVSETIRVCEEAQADLGIMFDADSDRCGFVVPGTIREDGVKSDYQPLNRNRLIALLGVVFARSSPGCAIVTCSVTSEGLSSFLQDKLGLQHVRYVKGYANVINKAKDLTKLGELNAEVAIETSGHCAMKENSYLDDGTYTAVKVVGLLARERASGGATVSLLDLISDMPELDEVNELRMTVLDGSLPTTQQTFDFCALAIECLCDNKENDKAAEAWEIDSDNLEGIRVRLGNDQFFMLRKSLHDPLISLQIEMHSKDQARREVVEPLLRLFGSDQQIKETLDLAVLREY